MKSEELDKRFDSGEDISKYLDLSRSASPGRSKNGLMSISRFG